MALSQNFNGEEEADAPIKIERQTFDFSFVMREIDIKNAFKDEYYDHVPIILIQTAFMALRAKK